MKATSRPAYFSLLLLTSLVLVCGSSMLLGDYCSADTQIKIKAVTGIGYAVDWIEVRYIDRGGASQSIKINENLSLGQQRTISVPQGARDIRIEAKPLLSFGSTRIFHNLALAGEEAHCFELTGTVNSPHYHRIRCNWNPAGRLSVYDDQLRQNVGLKRVKVSVKRHGITLGSAFADDNGAFRIATQVEGKVNYEISFEDREGLKVIRVANPNAQDVNFEERDTELNYTFTRSGDQKQWYWATVYNAAQFYKDYAQRDQLPFKDNAKISVMYENLRSYAPVTGVQDAVIYRYGGNSQEVFQNVMHELSHLTHAEIDRNKYSAFAVARISNQKSTAYGETWACGPEIIYVNRRYNAGSNELNAYQGERLAPYVYAKQGEDRYLYIHPVVFDLMDNYNQRVERNSTELPVDRVSGYTLRQIALALRGAGNMEEWKRNLAQVNNPTNVYLDEYFNQFNERTTTRTGSNTIIKLKPVAGVGYSVDWVRVNYTDAGSENRTINRETDIPLGQQATITVPEGGTNITIEAKPRASLSGTRIFNQLRLNSSTTHCIHLKGTVNHPSYTIVNCSSF